ncbi:MAG: multicopper oxidase domain-containing protein [Pseudolabrys sp.]
MGAHFSGSNLGICRRRLLQLTAGTAAYFAFMRRGFPYAQSPLGLKKFVQALNGLGPTGIPVATPIKSGGVDRYRIEVGEFTNYQFHPDLPPTRLWGYADVTGGVTPLHRYLGGVVVARRGTPVSLTVINKLPNTTHPLPVDNSIPGAEANQPVNRTTTHLHGGLVPWTSDGGPFSWFTSAANWATGASFQNGTGVKGEAQYYYPNDQSARLVWYHDHAIGTTRLNAYAGIASGYIIRDDVEDFLIGSRLIPSSAQEIPLIIQDKTFVDGSDPNYTFGHKGDLWYPYKYEPNSQTPPGTGRWDYGPDASPPGAITGPLPTPSAVPESFSDTTIVNGVAYPFVEVEQRHYRFRILNGSQARFYNLQLYFDNGQGDANLNAPGPAFIQIGTEGGFLPLPVKFNDQQIAFDNDPNSPTFGNATQYNLLLGSAERADVIIDFTRVPVGSKLILYNDAPAPFPVGDSRNDYFTGDPDQTSIGGAATTPAGFGPNTRTLMQFRVKARSGAADPASMNLLAAIAISNTPKQPRNPLVAGNPLPAIAAPSPSHALGSRDLTLNEDFDDRGRLIQMLGTNVSNGTNSQGLVTFSRTYESSPTEVVEAGTTEIWRLFNLTGDTHPIHFHLVNVHVLSRQIVDVNKYFADAKTNPGKPVTPTFLAPAHGPDANEWGFKETVRMNPSECTTVIMKFDLPKVPFKVPPSTRFPGIANANEYVWHCHILEHEEHDMMRPLVVTDKKMA